MPGWVELNLTAGDQTRHEGVEMLSTLIKDLIDFTRGAVKKPEASTRPRNVAVVHTDADGEEQAYQEAKREHPGG